MATDSLPTTPADAPGGAPNGAASPAPLIGGLVWAAAMTGLLALWLSRKYALPAFYPIILVILALGFLGLAIWHAFTLFKRDTTTPTALRGQQSLFASALVGAGIFFVFSGAYFLFSFGLTAISDGVGLILFGLTAIVCSILLNRRLNPRTRPGLLEWIEANPLPCGKFLVGLGIILLLVYYFLFWNGVAGAHLLPELLGLVLIILVLAGVGVFLIRSSEDLSATTARILVLILGGVTGLAVFVAAVGRTIAWRDTTLFGGLSAWQGENAWRLWLCAYLGILALGLMTASLLLARADIRSNALLRRVFYGFNTGVTALLLFLVLVILNIVVFALFPYQFDWTGNRGVYSLAESTKGLLNRLEKDTTVYVILPRSRDEFQDLYTFLENCAAQTTKFHFKHWSPDSDPIEVARLAKHFPTLFQNAPGHGPVPRRGGLLVVYGDLPDDPDVRVPNAFVPANDLYDVDRKKEERAVSKTFKGELELMKQINGFVAAKKGKIYILQGSGELDIFQPEAEAKGRNDLFFRDMSQCGGAKLKKFLAGEGYEVLGLSFGAPGPKAAPGIVYAQEDPVAKSKKIPDDAAFLLVPGPSQPMSADTLTALDRYLEKGGKLMAFFDIVTERDAPKLVPSGLETVLKRYGVDVSDEFLIVAVPDEPLAAFASAPRKTDFELAQLLQKMQVVCETVRVVRPGGVPGKFEAEPLLQVSRDVPRRVPGGLVPQMFILESNPAFLRNPLPYLQSLDKTKQLEARLARDPATIGLAVRPAGGKDKKPQIYVFGDTDFVSDALLNQFPPGRAEMHFDFVRSCLEYSSERPGLIGPRPRTTKNYLPQAETNYGSLAVVPGWIMALSLLGFGGGLWLIRRR
ncbi:MAG: Gldg family protein [Gemmataceae bacterium]